MAFQPSSPTASGYRYACGYTASLIKYNKVINKYRNLSPDDLAEGLLVKVEAEGIEPP
jgi:hypothetical protein